MIIALQSQDLVLTYLRFSEVPGRGDTFVITRDDIVKGTDLSGMEVTIGEELAPVPHPYKYGEMVYCFGFKIGTPQLAQRWSGLLAIAVDEESIRVVITNAEQRSALEKKRPDLAAALMEPCPSIQEAYLLLGQVLEVLYGVAVADAQVVPDPSSRLDRSVFG